MMILSKVYQKDAKVMQDESLGDTLQLCLKK
jgi:hypothetical protein